MSINQVLISGNLTRDAQLRQTQSGLAVLSFGVAVNERKKNQQSGEWEDYANFVDCTVFGKRAEKLEQYLAKGTKVAINGRLKYDSWMKDDEKRSKLSVVVDNLDFMTSRRDDVTEQAASASERTDTQTPVQQMANEDIPF